jgi:hypothetical protein
MRTFRVVFSKVFPGLFLLAVSVLLPSAPSDAVTEVKTFVSRDRVHAGERFKVAVRLAIGTGWHINASEVNDDFLVPTIIEIEKNDLFRVEDTAYPPAFTVKFDFSEADALVFTGDALFGMMVIAGDGVAPGIYKLKGSVLVQACNAKSCLAPETLGFEIAVAVAESDQITNPAHAEIFDGIVFRK